MAVGLTTANKNLTVNGNAVISGRCIVGGNSVQRAIANGFTLSGETALFVFPCTVRFLKAGAGVNLTTDTSTSVVMVKTKLSNYGSGAGVQYLLDATAQDIDSLLPGNSVTVVNKGIGSIIVHYKPFIAFCLVGNIVPTNYSESR